MKNKLPKVFVNQIEKPFTNNEKVYYSKEKNREFNEKKESNVVQKINSIFRSSKYTYKMNVVIETKNGTMKKKIIGKNKNYLITIENEKIPIKEILDIQKET